MKLIQKGQKNTTSEQNKNVQAKTYQTLFL